MFPRFVYYNLYIQVPKMINCCFWSATFFFQQTKLSMWTIWQIRFWFYKTNTSFSYLEWHYLFAMNQYNNESNALFAMTPINICLVAEITWMQFRSIVLCYSILIIAELRTSHICFIDVSIAARRQDEYPQYIQWYPVIHFVCWFASPIISRFKRCTILFFSHFSAKINWSFNYFILFFIVFLFLFFWIKMSTECFNPNGIFFKSYSINVQNQIFELFLFVS